MFARVATVHVSDATTSAEILAVHERLYANLKRLQGFRDYVALVNRQTGEAKAIIFWDTRADMEAQHAMTTALLSRIGVDLNTTPPQVEDYDVAFHS